MIFLQSLSYLYYGPFIPHFISVRELYDRELRARSQGIDTGFGVLSNPTSSGNTAMSAIVFGGATPLRDLGTEGVVEDSDLIADDAH